MDDELSYGRDQLLRQPPRGWWATTAIIAIIAALMGWQLRGTGPTERPAVTAPLASAATPTASPTAPPTATPTEFQGPVLRDGVRAEVVLGGPHPGVVALPTGKATPITGVADGWEVTQLVRVRDTTVLLAGRSPDPWMGRQRLYSLRDGSAAARRLPGSATGIAPGETDRTFWIFQWSGESTPQFAAEERDVAGRLIRLFAAEGGAVTRRGVAVQGV